MPLPEYIPSDLPQYASSVDRTSFNSAVVQSGDALLLWESGHLLAKKHDGNFYEIGGGVDVSDTTATPADVLVTAAFYDSTGTKQSGTIPTVSAGISGSVVVVPSGYIAASQTFPISGGVDVSSTTAEAGGVLSGLVFYDSTGNQTTGTIPTVSAAVSGSNVVVPVGYIGTSQTFPVTGGGIDLSSTTAVSGGVLSGLIFYDSAGNKTTGTIPTVSAAVSGSNLVIQSGYLGVSLAIPIFMDVSSTTITADMVLSGGIFYDSAGVQRSGTIPTVSAIRSDAEIIVPSGYISSPQWFNVSGGVDVSDTTAEDYMVMSGALFYDSDGNLTTGTIPYVSAPEEIIPTTSYQTISGGGYLDMDIVIDGDPYLVPQNIKAGVWIFGVEGTYGDFSEVTAGETEVLEGFTFLDAEGSLRSGTIPYAVVPDYWITPTTTSQQIGSGYLDDNVVIAGDSNLVASNIRSGVTIFDIEGEYEGSGGFDFSDVTVDPEDVLEDEVFYDSNGDLQFGTMRAEYDIEPIMPSTSSQVVSGDCYLGADLIISGDSNLVASNIRAGVTIFGVTGSYSATGESVVPGYIVNSNGSVMFQPLASGAQAEIVSSLKIVSTGQPEPAYGSSSSGSETEGPLYGSRGVFLTSSGTVISSAITMDSATVGSNEIMKIYSSGTANSTAISSGGSMLVYDGGVASSTAISSGGSMAMHWGGTANNTTVSSGGRMEVTSHGIANNTDLSVDGARLIVWNSGTANSTTVGSGGSMTVYYDGIANGVTLNSDGSMSVEVEGTANNVTINSGGRMSLEVGSGMVANSVTVNSGGELAVHSGGTALNVVSSAGANIVSSAGAVITYA
jgi:autotransporter passenger strand-loop-strand repeat protein